VCQPVPAATPRRLHHNIGYAVIGNVAFNACRFVVVILLAQFGTVGLVGAFGAAMAWSAPVINFSMLQLRSVYVADTRGDFSFGAYVTLRRLGMGFALLGMVVVLLWRASRDPEAWWFIPLLAAVSFSKITWGLGEIYWGVYQRQERLDLMAAANGWRGLIMLAPFAVVMPVLAWRGVSEGVLFHWTTGLCGVYAVGWLFYAIWVDDRVARGLASLDMSWDWRAISHLARHAAPLGMVILIVTACDNVPQMVLDELGQGAKEALGHYSVMANFILPLNLLVIAIGHGAANRIADSFDRHRARYWRQVAALMGITVVFGLGAILATGLIGEWILVTLYGQAFCEHATVFSIIGLGGGLLLLASMFGLILTATGSFLLQVPVQLVVLVVTIAAAWSWIPQEPVSGAAWTFVARSGVHALLYGVVLILVGLGKPGRGTVLKGSISGEKQGGE
jgi:O-antigen/teichoic acid export membrane protein